MLILRKRLQVADDEITDFEPGRDVIDVTAFATDFAKTGLQQTRYENYQDIVPLVPPGTLLTALIETEVDEKLSGLAKTIVDALLSLASSWDYGPVGDGHYIDSDGDLHDLDILWEGVQLDAVKDVIESGDYSKFAAAHCHSCHTSDGKCQGGYMKGVCPGEICPSG